MKIYFDPILRKLRVKDDGSGGGSTPTATTYAALSTDISGGIATEGFYLITDACSGASLGAKPDLGLLVQVFNDATGNRQYVRLEAEGVFFNVDYNGVGDYSSVSGYNSSLGIWNSGLAPVAGDVVIWSGLHYKNLTGAVGTAPSGDLVNWSVIAKSTSTGYTSGYIAESDFALYDFTNDALIYRADARKNTVHANGIQDFPWGNDSVLKNNVQGSASLSALNYRGGSLTELNISGEVAVQMSQLCLGDIDCVEISGINALTLDLNSGKYMYNCKIQNKGTTAVAAASDYDNLIKSKGYSDFSASISITGLTTLDITAANNYVGVVNLTNGGGATESIDTFSNFPSNHPVRFYPSPNIILTFVHGTSANQPRCYGEVNVVLDGANGDWIEFTASGTTIRQTGGMVSSERNTNKLFNYNNFS